MVQTCDTEKLQILPTYIYVQFVIIHFRLQSFKVNFKFFKYTLDCIVKP